MKKRVWVTVGEYMGKHIEVKGSKSRQKIMD
jgi:hypothetical protein